MIRSESPPRCWMILRRLAAFATTVLVACGGDLPPAPAAPERIDPATVSGFQVDRALHQAVAEERILGLPSAERMDAYHLALTAEPHHAGTAANEATAEYVAEQLRAFGFDSIVFNRYEVLLPRPLERQVTLLGANPVELPLDEPPLEADPDTKKDGALPPFHAFSPDGDVTADVVYVNYGLPEDYAVLDSLGISVEGRIVLARYGRSWRGIKPRLAAERGAVGALIYSDPEDDGFVRGPVLPDGKWRPEFGVQRGSVMDMPLHPGDPQTPFNPSLAGAERIPLEEAPTIQAIPVQPLSYGAAEPILRALEGPEVPEAWQGGLPLDYRVGPGPARVRLRLRFDWSVRPIVNVIGVLRGSEEPDKIVMAGGHRDAWTFGGRDPNSGTVSLLESARAIGALARDGDRPRRSIAIAAWDAEDYGLIGSTEYGEEFADQLPGQVVAYVNRESYTAGPFRAAGSHSLQPLVNEVLRVVDHPDGDGSVFDRWAEEAGDDATLEWRGRSDVRLGALGSGSDYTVFLDHLGIPSLNLGFDAPNGVYHSRYDTHWFFTNFGDPGYRYGERLAEAVALVLLRLANADLLPFDIQATAETVSRYLVEVTELAESSRVALDVEVVSRRVQELGFTGAQLTQERDRIVRMDAEVLAGFSGILRQVNEHLLDVERGFLHAEGLPGRPWYRHTLYAPGFYTGYGVKTLPGIREAVEKGDAAEAAAMVDALGDAVVRARDSGRRALLLMRGITGPEAESVTRNDEQPSRS